jgi:hypothetical protein
MTTYEIDNLDAVALVHERLGEEVPLQNREVVLHGNPARIDGERRQKIGDRHRRVDFVGLTVERDEHNARVILSVYDQRSRDN